MSTTIESHPPGPLAGTRVIDCGRLLPSGWATAVLAARGADVVKVEHLPHGDYLRVNEPHIEGLGDMHLEVNRNKRSIAVDLATEDGRQLVLRLASRADVFVESSRPGTFDRLGLGFDDVKNVNPGIIYCSISGFGQEGPYAGLGAHGLSADAAAGLLQPESTHPRLPDWYLSVGPRAAGAEAAFEILAALLGRNRDPRARYLDVSQWAAAVRWNFRDTTLAANGEPSAPGYSRLGPRFDIYDTADGKSLLLCAPERTVWQRFCTAAGRSELSDRVTDEVIGYAEDGALRNELKALFMKRPAAAWLELAAVHGLPLAPVLTPDALACDPHARYHHMTTSQPHPLGGEVRLGTVASRSDGMEPLPAPALGQHTDEVLEEIGIDPSECAELRRLAIVR